MCGIVGLLIKQPEETAALGKLLLPMFECMSERGPDSGGLAVFHGQGSAATRRYNLYSRDRGYDWENLLERWCAQDDTPAELLRLENHAILITPREPEPVKAWLAEFHPSLDLLSVGHSIDVYKDEGPPAEIARRYHFGELAGSHSIGHTRMATESAVSPAHAHPFTAGEDFCLVHNGSLSNPYMLRRKLEAEGLRFETDNDTEAACRFIEWRMRQGETLDDALTAAFRELDGFYTLLIATATQMTLVRDAFACKPAVVAETDAYVAVASEYRSLAHLPGVARARIFEPHPEEIYSWTV